MLYAKWPPFCRWHFQILVHFLEWKLLNLKYNCIEICSLRSNGQYSSIGSDNGLALIRRQAIIYSNVCIVCQCIYTSLGLNELKSCLTLFSRQLKWEVHYVSSPEKEVRTVTEGRHGLELPWELYCSTLPPCTTSCLKPWAEQEHPCYICEDFLTVSETSVVAAETK